MTRTTVGHEPKIVSTRLKLKPPTSPQLSAPTHTRIQAILWTPQHLLHIPIIFEGLMNKLTLR